MTLEEKSMNKKYDAPEMEMTEFETEDVIQTSPPAGEGGGDDNWE